MIPPLPLVLVNSNRTSAKVSAGWLASADPVEWLREVAHARAQGCHLAIYPVAGSLADPRPVGVFLLPKGAPAPVFRPRVMPLAELLPGIHAPQHSVLSAGLLENERAFFFPHPLQFFHPSLGVIGFDPKDELSPARLLIAPERPAPPWNWAVPAPATPPSFRGISVILPADAEGLMEEIGREIGDQSGKLPEEKTSLGKRLGTLGVGLIGGGVLGIDWVWSKLTGSGPAAGNGPAGKGALARWAEENWERLIEGRQREIERLMELLEKDPDLGLRYALPLAGISGSRGPKPAPGWKLGQRSTTLKMGHGNTSVDGWDIGPNERLALEKQYRDAAAREISLGRHERAAYILGNLLSDWNGAAKALAAAGRHHDAVSIYLHKTRNPLAAARCLEDAGLLFQAADLYVEAKAFEKAGDLHAKLGNMEEARRLWGLALQESRDLYEKARIARDKMNEPEVAATFLESLWKAGNRPERALELLFSILGEQEKNTEAIALIGRIFEESPGTMTLRDRIAIILDETDRRPGDSTFRKAMEPQVYRHIGHALMNEADSSAVLTALLPRLDARDLLLERDAKRYSIPKTRMVPPRSARPKGEVRRPIVVRIPNEARWQSLAWLKKGASVAGHGNGTLMTAQLRMPQCLPAAIPAPQSPSGNAVVRHISVTSLRGNSRLFHFPATGRLHYRSLDRARTPADDAIGDLSGVLSIGPHGDGDEFMLLEQTTTGTLSVSIYSEAGALRRTQPIDFAPPSDMKLTWFCAGRGGNLCFTAEGFFAWRRPSGEFDTVALDECAGGLHLAKDSATTRVLLPRRHEVLLIEPGKPGEPLETINLFSQSSGPIPVACFTRDGHVVVAGAEGGSVYVPGNYLDAVHRLVIPADAGHPIDACAHGDGGFVLLTSTGNLLVFT